MESNPNEKQVGGLHYKTQAIQTWDFISQNNIPFLEGSAIKYIARHTEKNGEEDIRKAIHFLEKVLDNYEKAGMVEKSDV